MNPFEDSDFEFHLERRRRSDEIRRLQQDGDTEAAEHAREERRMSVLSCSWCRGAGCVVCGWDDPDIDSSWDRIREGRSPS